MSIATAQALAHSETQGFTSECSAVLQRLRISISEALSRIPNRVRSRGDVQKILGVDSKLSWHVMKLAGPGDPLSLAQFVPTAVPMRRFLSAIADIGVDGEIVEQIRTAYEMLEKLIELHAGDRVTFESMASSAMGSHELVNEDLQRAAVRQRKGAYQINSHYCGVNIETILACSLMHPSPVQGGFDTANLFIKCGMRRLRKNTRFVANRSKCTRNSDLAADNGDGFAVQSLDPESYEKFGAPVLPRFCSQPLPQFKTITEPNGGSFTRIVGDTIGQLSSVDLVFGEVSRYVSTGSAPINIPQGEFGHATNIRYPVAAIIMDQLVHRPSFPKLVPSFRVDWQPRKYDDPVAEDERDDPLPFSERLLRLDAGVDDARIREVPQYIQMLDYVCERMKWKTSDFDVYRVKVEYPLLSTQLLCKFLVDAQGK